MVQKKPTKKALAARKKARDLRNPITGTGPNQFTAVGQGRSLAPPKAVQPYERPVTDRRRMRDLAVKTDEAVDAPVGYRMDAVDPRYRTFVTGARQMFPNTAAEQGVPAINEPHKHESGVTVQRRAEDLSGREYRKGEAVLKHFGHDPRDPVGSVQRAQSRALDRVSAEHIVAGVNESASQLFYGGHVTSDFPDIEHAITHEEHQRETPDMFDSKVHRLVQHPAFVNATGHLSHPERISAARNLMASATADTSPNSMWKAQPGAKRTHPNLDQAEEAVHAALEQRTPEFIAGRPANVDKAASRVADALDTGDFSVHQYGNPAAAAKTVAFRGAQVNKDSPDAFKVSDVHEASVMAPHLPTAKSHKYRDAAGARSSVYPDQPTSATRGKTQEFVSGASGKIKPEWGLSRPEQMLAEGAPIVHALNDYATRRVLASRGLSRGVNYADNTHSFQAATWGSQQTRRPDVNTSPAAQYPVVRNWASEGVNVPSNPDKPVQSLQRGHTHTELGPQFHANPKTGRTQSVFDPD
jgi:hypothetical protein